MSKDVSLISLHPFIRGFVLSIVRTIREKNFKIEERIVVDADLVPKGSERVMMAPVRVRTVVPAPVSVPVRVEKDVSRLLVPTQRPTLRRGVNEGGRVVVPLAQVRRAVVPAAAPAIVAPAIVGSGSIEDVERYGKISPLLNDPSVSTIECLGKDKELMIVRAGQKQRTKVVLSAKEIKAILDVAADEAHIPLLEGVFRANVKGFSMSAVISDIIGSRFVIKKAAAYSL